MKPNIFAFAWLNIRKQTFSFALLFFMILFGSGLVFSLSIVYSSIEHNINQYITFRLKSDEILIKPKQGLLAFFFGSQESPITPEFLQEMKTQFPEIMSTTKLLYLNIPISAEIPLYGEILVTDIFLVGVEPSFIEDESLRKNFVYNEEENFIPLIISEYLANSAEEYLMNQFSNEMQDTSLLKSMLKRMDGKILFGYSSFFHSEQALNRAFEVQGQVIGYSKKTPLFFLGIPLDFAEKRFEAYTGKTPGYSEVILRLAEKKPEQLKKMEKILEQNEIILVQPKDLLPFKEKALMVFTKVFYGILALVALLISGFSLLFLFLFIEKNKKDFATLIALGAPKSYLYRLYAIEMAGLFGLVFLILYTLMTLALTWFDSQITQLLQKKLHISLEQFWYVDQQNLIFLALFLGSLFVVSFLVFIRAIRKLNVAKIMK